MNMPEPERAFKTHHHQNVEFARQHQNKYKERMEEGVSQPSGDIPILREGWEHGLFLGAGHINASGEKKKNRNALCFSLAGKRKVKTKGKRGRRFET